MGIYEKVMITSAGDVMRNKNLIGDTINFNRMAIGTGIYDDTVDLYTITNLKEERLSTNSALTKNKINSSTTYISGIFENKGVISKIPVREVALFALDDDMNEVLFAYAKHDFTQELFYIPTEENIFGYSVEIQILVDSVSVDKIEIVSKLIIDPSEIGINIPQIPEAENLRDIIDIIINAITPAHH